MFTISHPRILVVGDVHGDFRHLDKACAVAYNNDISIIVQLGDFWVYDYNSSTSPVAQMFFDAGGRILFIPGNHEDWNYLDSLGSTVPVATSDLVTYLPVGSVLAYDTSRVLCVGKAPSIDKDFRTADVDWFEQEALTDFDTTAALGVVDEVKKSGDKIDVMLCHDTPWPDRVPSEAKLPEGSIPMELANYLRETPRRLRTIYKAARPSLLLHGHYHCDYTFYPVTDDSSGVICGLDRDGRAGSMYILNLSTSVLSLAS